MRILVTGSQGYIGSILAPMLMAEGHEAVGLDSDLFQSGIQKNDVTAPPPFRFLCPKPWCK